MVIMEIETRNRVELIDITDQVQQAVKNSDVQDGICVISTTHTTTSIIVNENERGLRADILVMLEKMVPESAGYSHNRIDYNADAHLKAVLLGCSETVPIVDGEIVLGAWQNVFFAEFDGPRKREINITIVG